MEPGQIRILNAIMTTELDIIAQRAFARKEGRREGLEEGREEERRSIVKALLDSGMTLEEISRRLKIPVEELEPQEIL